MHGNQRDCHSGGAAAAWCGVMLAGLALRRRDCDEPDLYRPTGRYGDVSLTPLLLTLTATVLGRGQVTDPTASLRARRSRLRRLGFE